TFLYDSHCYMLYTATATWSDAKSVCDNSSSTLLTINSEEERTHLTDIMISSFPSLPQVWTGLNDIAVEGNPVWLTGDHPIYNDYDHEPGTDSEGKDCFQISASDRSLRHADCQLEFGYICE
ncbi:regenerating islet-derived protein 3-alpha-like, partial [Anneissia japonica]|uniref:regenerating islet-derived protein 3-alpha-like n=1 Tax=Anneissia japonica TaxID=1529436 RepID=UPI0014256624